MDSVYDKYGDIIDMEYKKSVRRKPMPVSDRAAQFSAFQALSGYGEAVKRTAEEVTAQKDADDFMDITIC